MYAGGRISEGLSPHFLCLTKKDNNVPIKLDLDSEPPNDAIYGSCAGPLQQIPLERISFLFLSFFRFLQTAGQLIRR